MSAAAAFHKIILAAEQARAAPPEPARQKLESLNAALSGLHPFFQGTTPSFGKINAARAEVETALVQVLQALSR
jgi:hypothetical protein